MSHPERSTEKHACEWGKISREEILVDSILRHLTTQRVPLLSKRKRSILGISKKIKKQI
jgi:hypothetical protein